MKRPARFFPIVAVCISAIFGEALPVIAQEPSPLPPSAHNVRQIDSGNAEISLARQAPHLVMSDLMHSGQDAGKPLTPVRAQAATGPLRAIPPTLVTLPMAPERQFTSRARTHGRT